MTSQSKHCNDGPIPEELLLSGCLVENDSIQLQTLYEEPLETTRHNPRKRPRSATPESNDRLQISDSITQNVKLAQGLTGNAKVLLPFWNEYTREESKKWWLPERTDCVISDLSLWDESLKKMGLNSWYSVRMSAPKVVKPSNSLSQRWIGTARWTYNQCLSVVEKEGVNRNKKDLWARCLNAVNFRNNAELKWVLETPYDIRDEAMNDLLKGYSTNFATNRKKFKMKFRSKKDPHQSIVIHSKHWGKSRGEYSFLPKMKSAEPLPNKLEYDSRLVVNQLGEFYLCIPRPLEIRAENQGPMFQKEGSEVISLDPGVRTFMTGYDPSGMAVEWGKNDIGRIYRLCHAYDKLQSKRDQIHGKRNKQKRYRLRHVMLQIYKKIRCLVNDCHYKLVKWLCENYYIILLPEFRTQEMI
ncbi:hypothetical protein RclHR1_00600021 [Rhizophagus clarus]|uniref:Transposase putative helix-turn-helix domain-containing protein n=1 Tax=Rhizophagus clarus TaxID=94130 RepID=A0A2Z6RPV8_9GLOM|nr:hypothetical protein RclHR1_00600021 [Rhizophagus clarus]